MADVGPYVETLLSKPLATTSFGSGTSEPVPNNPMDYYNELYKEWGGVEGLRKWRANNNINPVISYKDFDTPFYRQWGADEMEKGIKTYNPFDLMNREGSVEFSPLPERALGQTLNNGRIKISPEGTTYIHFDKLPKPSNNIEYIRANTRWHRLPQEIAKDVYSHELFHTLQPDDAVRGKTADSQEEQPRRIPYMQPVKSSQPKEPPNRFEGENVFPYWEKPVEVTARMSNIMKNFVRDKKIPVIDDDTAGAYLEYLKKNDPKEYELLTKRLQMTDEQIKGLSKKIVSNDIPQRPSVYQGFRT